MYILNQQKNFIDKLDTILFFILFRDNHSRNHCFKKKNTDFIKYKEITLIGIPMNAVYHQIRFHENNYRKETQKENPTPAQTMPAFS